MIFAPALFSTEVAVQTTKLPIGQLLELLIPFTGIAFFYAGMIGAFLSGKKTTFLSLVWLMVSFITLGLLAIGQGIHFSAQTLNHFVVTNKIFGELREVAYLFNEKLTHLIWLPAVIGFPSIVAGWEFVSPQQKDFRDTFLPSILFGTVSGGWYGLITALAILEAQLAKFAFTWLIGLLVFVIGAALLKKKVFSLGSIISITSSMTTLLLLLLWRVYFGGFPEPLNVLF